MIEKEIHTYIEHPEMIDNEIFNKLKDIVKQYPYFHLARILYLKSLYGKNRDKFYIELKKSTVYIPDKKQLFKFLNEDLNFNEYKQRISSFNDSTEEKQSTIEDKSNDGLLEFEVTNIDNTSVYDIEKETNRIEESPKEEHKDNQQLIDEFIKNSPRISKTNCKEIDTKNYADRSELDEECMTETLAKIYVKQKLYRKAIAVYEKLSLKNPQKSVYFVNHVNELKKILNDKL